MCMQIFEGVYLLGAGWSEMQCGAIDRVRVDTLTFLLDSSYSFWKSPLGVASNVRSGYVLSWQNVASAHQRRGLFSEIC
jgi:hypothetical protein